MPRGGTNRKTGKWKEEQDGGPGPGQRIPHSLVLEAEARAQAVDVITGAAVVQQADEGGGNTICMTGPPELRTPSSAGCQAPLVTLRSELSLSIPVTRPQTTSLKKLLGQWVYYSQ